MSQNNNTIDWDSILDKDTVHQAGKKAARQTNTELSHKISSLTNLTQKDIQNTFPKKSDKEKLIALMQIVDSDKNRQDKVNDIVHHSEKFASTILSLLQKFI